VPLDPDHPDFQKQMRKLTEAVYALLQGLGQANPAPSAVTEPKPEDATTHTATNTQTGDTTETTETTDNKGTLYFAEVSDTLRKLKKKTITDLQKEGYQVITDIPPPMEAQPHNEAVTKALQQADLSIHLLDEFEGREIVNDDTNYYGLQQAQLGNQYAKNQLIWVPKNIELADVEEQQYRSYLEALEQGQTQRSENLPGTEFVRGMKNSLTREILEYLEVIQAQKADSNQTSNSVLVDTHFNDQLYALELSRLLIEHQIQPFINPQEDDPKKNLNLLADRAAQVNNLVFLYGNISKAWVVERVKASLQLIINNSLPIDDILIVLFPDKKSPDDIAFRQRFLRIDVVDNSSSNQLLPQNLATLINTIKGRGHA